MLFTLILAKVALLRDFIYRNAKSVRGWWGWLRPLASYQFSKIKRGWQVISLKKRINLRKKTFFSNKSYRVPDSNFDGQVMHHALSIYKARCA